MCKFATKAATWQQCPLEKHSIVCQLLLKWEGQVHRLHWFPKIFSTSTFQVWNKEIKKFNYVSKKYKAGSLATLVSLLQHHLFSWMTSSTDTWKASLWTTFTAQKRKTLSLLLLYIAIWPHISIFTFLLYIVIMCGVDHFHFHNSI